MVGDNDDFTEKVAFKSPLKHLDMGVGKCDVLSVVSGQAGSKRDVIRIMVINNNSPDTVFS